MRFAPGDILYNQYNFDPVVFAWNMDPKTLSGISPYEVFGNNPVRYSDFNGDIKFDNNENRFPLLRAYFSSHFENDVMNNIRAVNGLKMFGQYPSENAIRNEVRWDEGPTVKFVENPMLNNNNDFGKDHSYGYYDHSSNTIYINLKIAQDVEKVLKSPTVTERAVQAALYTIFKGMIHELGHRGDYLYQNGAGDNAHSKIYTMEDGWTLHPRDEPGAAAERYFIGNYSANSLKYSEATMGIGTIRVSFEQLRRGAQFNVTIPNKVKYRNVDLNTQSEDYNFNAINKVED